MATDSRGVLGRVRSHLRGSSRTAWALGAAVSVAVFFGVVDHVAVPESVPWLLAAGVGPAVYYRLHYESVEVESSFGRRAFRANVLLVAWTLTGSPSLEPVLDALRFVGLLALFDAISTSARVNVVDPVTDADGDEDAGDAGRISVALRRIEQWVRSRRVVRALQSRRRSAVATLRADSGVAWWFGVLVGGGAAAAAWYWYRVPSIVLWGFVSGLGAMVYYWTHYEWRNPSDSPRDLVLSLPASVASFLFTPETAGYGHWLVVFAALWSLAYAVWYSAGSSVVESPRSGDGSSAGQREEAARRDRPWERSGWSEQGGG